MRAVPALILAALVAPVALGLWQTGRAAFGIMPALGRETPSLEAWRQLFALPGLGGSIRLSLVSGLGAAILSLPIALALVQALQGRLSGARAARWLAPFLAVPHAALAIGMAFLLAPSGWIARALAPVMDWTRPPGIASVNDPFGMALMLGLMVKEIPFLMLVILAALGQVPLARIMAMGRALGYGPGAVWLRLVLPAIWPMLRLPFWVVLVYSVSNVDMAIILGPANPPVLGVAVTRWFASPDLAMILPASAGAILQAGLAGAVIAAAWGAERLAARLGPVWLARGGRGPARAPGWLARALLRLAAMAGLVLMAAGLLAMAALAIWSLAFRWSFPQILPETWSLNAWSMAAPGWRRALTTSVLLAGATASLSLALAVAWLQAAPARLRAEWLILLPLLVPQIGFLYGLNVLFLRAGLEADLLAVGMGQMLFVFPYVLLSLSGPWRAVDPRLMRTAAALGAGPWRRLVAVRLPVLLRPLLTAWAIGIAVSVAQYLPTLYLGAGRVATLTTEAVTLASGSDRRVSGVYASLQALVPLVAYASAFVIPAWWHRDRRALAGAFR